jgi:hypothetical protein
MSMSLIPWKWEGTVLVGGTSREFAAFAKKQIDADITTGDGAAGHAYVEYGKPWLLWVESLTDVAALAHEALHVAAGVLECRGLKHTDASEEAYTYTMEHIMRTALACRQWKAVS